MKPLLDQTPGGCGILYASDGTVQAMQIHFQVKFHILQAMEDVMALRQMKLENCSDPSKLSKIGSWQRNDGKTKNRQRQGRQGPLKEKRVSNNHEKPLGEIHKPLVHFHENVSVCDWL